MLLSTSLSQLHPSELKYIIGPILAKNEEDQKNIYQLIDAYVADRIKPGLKINRVRQWTANKRLVFALKVAGFLLILSAAVLLYVFQDSKPNKHPKSKQSPSTSESQTVPPVPDHNDETPQRKPSINAAPPANVSHVSYNGKSLEPVPQNIILQVAGAFGVGLGAILYYIIFYERKKIMEAKKKTRDEERPDISRDNERPDAAFSDLSAVLEFNDKNFLIRKTKEFAAIRSNLKRPALTDHVSLDVKRSVVATTKTAGFPSLVFDSQWKERKYLFLIDNKAPDSHISHLWKFLIHFLESADLSIQKYYFIDNIRELTDATGNKSDLDDFTVEFSDHHLIIFGDCRSFFTPDFIFPKDLAKLFGKWHSKSIITPFPLADWSYAEKQLQSNHFQVVPMEISAIGLLSKSIGEESNIKSAALESQVKDRYSVLKYEFKTANDIKTYLDNDWLFQLVCALSIYPRLDLNITLSLFAAILKNNPDAGIAPEFDTLLKISRVPWLHNGQLTASMRLELLDSIKPETEIIARETILGLLKEIDPSLDKSSTASKELRLQMKINSFFLYAHDQQKYKEHANGIKDFLGEWKNLKEWSLKQRSQNALMPIDSKGKRLSVEEFILQEEQFEKRNVTFLRVVLLTLPAALLYILLSVFKPGFVFPGTYEKVSFTAIIKKDLACQKQIGQVIITTLERFDTITINSNNSAYYIPVDNVDYYRSVNLSVLFTDNSSLDIPVQARDSLVTVSISCR